MTSVEAPDPQEQSQQQLTPEQHSVLLENTGVLIKAGIAGKYIEQLEKHKIEKARTGSRAIAASMDDLELSRLAELPFAVSVFYSADNDTHEDCRAVSIIKVDSNGVEVEGSNVNAGLIEEETLDIREAWDVFSEDDLQLLLERWQTQEDAGLTEKPFSF